MNRNINRGRRANLNSTKLSDIDTIISPHYEYSNTNSPHCLMELSDREWQRYKKSSILVSNRVISKDVGCDHIMYENVEYGSEVKSMKKRSISKGKSIWWEEINLTEMKSGILLITTMKKECINDQSIIIVDTCLRSKCNDKSDNKYKPSGIVVLLVCKLDRSHERTGRAWGKEHYIAIKQSKPNIIGSNMGHFGSEGHYYSHGNKGNFGIVDGSSVGQYVIKPYKK